MMTKKQPTEEDFEHFYDLGKTIEHCRQGIEYAPYSSVPQYKKDLAEAEQELAALTAEFDFGDADPSEWPGHDEERSYYDQ